MNEDKDPPPEDGSEEAKTVFVSLGEPSAPPEPQPPQAASEYNPPVDRRRAPAPPPADPEPASFQTSFAPRADGKGIQVGDVLNHIFEVKRFIARGGMGEVFEGCNVNSDERVAIKVMLPSLAADPNVIGMFRKEARTLTRLQHEALVQYRVLAQEPQLGVLYIVTEYIDGTNLSDVLGELNASPADLRKLLRRLAGGLRAAHALGAIHRDMSPDNVLLEDGKLDRAKVIDFGIAKDLDPGSATIVGEGFAGKLNYVAPEQLGDFGREIGPWTDIYSLGLVILAVAGGRNVQMGGSLVDAVDKRRAGADLSAAPDELKPVLEKMLRADPAVRLRSMDEVIGELDAIDAPPRTDDGDDDGHGSGRTMLIVAAGVGVLVVLLLGWLVFGGGLKNHPAASTPGAGGAPIAITRDPVDVARSVVDATLPSVECTWLRIVQVSKGDRGPVIKLTGVAGNPSAAQSEISRALSSQKIEGADINFEEVSPITQSGCAALDTFRQIRALDANRLSVPQRKFEMRIQPANTAYAGKNAANAIVEINIGDPKLDFALAGLEPSGKITEVIPDRAAFEATAAQSTNGVPVTNLGGDRYRLQIDLDHEGWSGLLLLTGKGPFEADVVAPQLGARGPDWRDKFVSLAAERGWQADMIWFKSVDEVKE